MDDHPPRDDRDPPHDAEPDLPPRSFSRAARRAAVPPPPDVPDFPFAFRELRRLTLEAETQFRWDSQQATWSQCAEHWRRRVQDMQLGDEDLDVRLSRMLLGTSTAAEPKHAPFFEASRVFLKPKAFLPSNDGRETTFPLPRVERAVVRNAVRGSFLARKRERRLTSRLPFARRRVVVESSADFEASLKIDAQNATWLDTQRQSWIEDVRDLGARVPFPPTPPRAVHLAARYLDQLVASVLPEAMKRAREGGWTARELELWHDRLSRVRLVCENAADESDRLFESRTSHSRAPRRRTPTSRSTLTTLEATPPRRHERLGGDSSAVLERADSALRRAAEALRGGAPGPAYGEARARVSAERLAALREDENYQALVRLYRDRMRDGTLPRHSARSETRVRLERTREDPERDALVAAAVSGMMRRSLERADAPFAAHVRGAREASQAEADVSAPASLAPFESEGEDDSAAGDASPRTPRTTPRPLRTFEDAERFFANPPPGADGRLLVPGAAASGERERRARDFVRGTAGTDPSEDRGDVSSSSSDDDDAPATLRRRGDGEAPPLEGVLDAGPARECPPRERTDVDEATAVDDDAVACPATLREMLADARRAAADSDAAAERARDDVTCQICYARRRDALVMPCCHLLYCYRCVARASEAAEARGHPDRCPCCRGAISGVLRCKLTE